MFRNDRNPRKSRRAWIIAIIVVLTSAPVFSAARGSTPSADDKSKFGRAIAMVLSGNGLAAVESLHSIDRASLSEAAARAHDCVLSRLEDLEKGATPTDLAKGAIAAYQAYWRDEAMDAGSHEAARARRDRRLGALLGMAGAQDGQRIESELVAALRKAGYFVRVGRTPPFDELILWRAQEVRTFDVALPEGHRTTRVVIMRHVTGKGWSDHLSCGLAGTGGWADRAVVHVIVDHFPDGLDDNAFVASLLTHESQHMADYAKSDELPAWRLEYRAKLAEVWSSDEANAQRLLATFRMIQSDDQRLPHPYANQKVIAALQARIGPELASADLQQLREIARTLLVDDSELLRSRASGP